MNDSVVRAEPIEVQGRMDDVLTEEQEMLLSSATEFLGRAAPVDTLNEREESVSAGEPPLWSEMVSLGWMGLVTPEQGSELAASCADVEILAEAMGSVLLPPPFLAVAVAAASALSAIADNPSTELLGELAQGRARPVLAVADPFGLWEREKPGCVWDGKVVNGCAWFVEGGIEADIFLVLAEVKAELRLVAVPAGGGVRVAPQATTVPGYWASVQFADAPGTLLAGGWPAVGSALTQAAIATSGWCAGAGKELLGRTVTYVSERHAFGVPIGGFQAVQHSLADCAMAHAESQSLARRAARAHDAGRQDAQRLASIAFVRSTRGLVEIARRCHQVWGGMGFTREAPVQQFSRRAKMTQMSWGGPKYHLGVIAADLANLEPIFRRYLPVAKPLGDPSHAL